MIHGFTILGYIKIPFVFLKFFDFLYEIIFYIFIDKSMILKTTVLLFQNVIFV